MGNRPSSSTSSSDLSSISTLREVSTDKLRKGFRQHAAASGGGENLAQRGFHDALVLLEDLGLRRLRETPLASRLFRLFDVNGDGLINEDEFVNGVSRIVADDTEAKLEMTFRAYAQDDAKGGAPTRVSIGAIQTLLVESWHAAFRFLYSRISQKGTLLPGETPPSSTHLMAFAKFHEQAFRSTVERSLLPFDPSRTGYLDREAFSRWSASDRTVKAQFGQASVQVAVTLRDIEKPPMYPTL